MKLKNILFLDALFGVRLVMVLQWILTVVVLADYAMLLKSVNNWQTDFFNLLVMSVLRLFFIRLGAEVCAVLFKLHHDVRALATPMTQIPKNTGHQV